jgi:hypothetical protein
MKRLLLGAFICACLTGLPAMADGHVAKAIEGAKMAYDEAVNTGFAWRDTGKMIKAAEKAAADGDQEKALDLAAKAKAQAEAAIAQAAREANAAPRI